MSEFRTIIEPTKPPFVIRPKDQIMAVGSCFAVEIGQMIQDRKFNIDLNPFGILFNPTSVATAIEVICKGEMLDREDLIEHEGLWHSLRHHGSFSSPNATDTLNRINARIERAHRRIEMTDVVILTLGSAHVYRHRETGILVANCHKIPADQFDKVLLSLEEIDRRLQLAISSVTKKNPSVKFIVSVSPVRHWKDGPVANQRSKARLILAAELLSDRNINVEYFPAYEVLIDDLRDYRFYADDLLHPSSQATKYIWNLFVRTYFSEEAKEFSKIFERFSQSLLHRSIHPNSNAERNRIQNLQKQLEKLAVQYAHIDFKKERNQIAALAK